MQEKPALVQQLRSMLAQVCPPDRLTILGLESFQGPSIHAPVPAMVLRLGHADPAPFDALRDRLRRSFPELPGERERGSESDSPARIAVEIARLLIAEQLHLELRCGDARGGEGESAAWIEYLHPHPAIQALVLAVGAVGGVASGSAITPVVLAQHRTLIERSCKRFGPGFDAVVLINAARRRDIPYLQIADDHLLWQFGWGRRSNLFWVTSSNQDGLAAHRLAYSKDITKRLFRQLGAPTPEWQVVPPDGDALAAAQSVGWPCVVKPLSGGGGVAVSANIKDAQTFARAVAEARRFSPAILVEAHQPGADHRLMVIDGRMVAAVRRDPAAVIGDGRSSVRALVEALNRTRHGNPRKRRFLTPVDEDERLRLTLAAQGLSMESVPAKGQKVALRTSANRGSGGTCTDVTADVHPQVRRMAETVTAAIGYRATGLDYVTPDIGRSHDEVGGAFLEANSTPGIEALLSSGIDEDSVGAAVLGTRPGRIPVALVLAGPDAIGPLAAAIEERLGPEDGLATSGSARIGTFALPHAQLGAAARATSLLRYPSAERLIVLWTPEDVEKHGLPVDLLDRTIISEATPAEDWLALIHRHSRQVVSTGSPAEAIEAVFAASPA